MNFTFYLLPMSAIRISAVTRGVPVQALVPDVVETVIIHRKIDIVATTLETTDNIIDMSIGTVVVHIVTRETTVIINMIEVTN